MAVTYHGATTLIVTGSSFTEYPSGLMRANVSYVCRTTQASWISSQLNAKTALPSFSSYTSQFAATREDRSDGFTYFSAIGYKGNAAVSRTTLGAVISNLFVPVKFVQTTSTIVFTNDLSLPASIISDTLTKIYTIPTSSSNAAISSNVGGGTISSTLSLRIIKQPEIPAGWTTPITFAQYLSASKDIINLERTNYGTIDEITVTWGYVFSFGTPFYATVFTP
jgi:hypothetical protein